MRAMTAAIRRRNPIARPGARCGVKSERRPPSSVHRLHGVLISHRPSTTSLTVANSVVITSRKVNPSNNHHCWCGFDSRDDKAHAPSTRPQWPLRRLTRCGHRTRRRRHRQMDEIISPPPGRANNRASHTYLLLYSSLRLRPISESLWLVNDLSVVNKLWMTTRTCASSESFSFIANNIFGFVHSHNKISIMPLIQ